MLRNPLYPAFSISFPQSQQESKEKSNNQICKEKYFTLTRIFLFTEVRLMHSNPQK